MEYLGAFGFCLSLYCLAKLGDLDKLKKKIRKLEKWNSNVSAIIDEEKDGIVSMSKLIEELVGKKCLFIMDGEISVNVEGMVLAVDEEWVKVELTKSSKKQTENEIQLMRIESIKEVRNIREEVADHS